MHPQPSHENASSPVFGSSQSENNPNSVFQVYTGKLLTKFRASVFDHSMKTGPCSTCVAATREFKNVEINKDIKSREVIIDQITKRS